MRLFLLALNYLLLRAMSDWTAEDTAAAAAQGWRLTMLWDQKYNRPEYEVRVVDGAILKTDENAQMFVNASAAKGNRFAAKAMTLIFQSKTGSLRPTPKRRTKHA